MPKFAVIPERCPSCGSDQRYDASCEAPGCDGIAYPCCSIGCDFEFDSNGECAAAAAAEPDDDRDTRIDAERAAFGLPPL